VEIVKRLDRLIRSYTVEESKFHSEEFRDAWNELDAFMAQESETADPPPVKAVSPSLERDFRILEVPSGSTLSEIRASYRKLLGQFHPDLHAGDPQKERAAAQVTRELTEAYQRIQFVYRAGERR